MADAKSFVDFEGRILSQPDPASKRSTAAYLLVSAALDDAATRGASYAAVTAARDDERLVIAVEDDGSERTSAMVQLADRVGALGGTLEVGSTSVQAAIPCA